MSHSVRSHLRLDIAAYDESIRRLIPGYEEGLARGASEIASIRPNLVIDLGVGTGALSEAILDRDGVGVVEGRDIDPEMLSQARVRLKRFGARTRFRECSFDEGLPACDAVAASLALHHVHTLAEKRTLYARIHRALRPGGLFANVDVTVSADPEERPRCYKVWAQHLITCGIDEQRAYRHFEEWAEEDTYFSLDEELAAMQEAGFEARCVWRLRPNTVMVGRKV